MNTILQGDALATLKTMPAESVQCCITSPPYWGLRDYGVAGQLGLEKTPEEFIQGMVAVFSEVKRVLKDDGTLWLNIGDSYASTAKNRTPEQARAKSMLGGGFYTQEQSLKQATKIVSGLKAKDLVGIPWMLAFALRADGWYLRQDIIWHKPNPMPESVTDRCTKAHEYIFLLSKSEKYFYDHEAIKEPAIWKETRPAGWADSGDHTAADWQQSGKHRKSVPKASFEGKTGEKAFRKTGDTRNKRSVWSVAPRPFSEAHFATYPPELITPAVLAGTKPGDVILDPFFGAGTTGLVAQNHERKYIGIELNPEYIAIAEKRLSGSLFAHAGSL